MGPTDRIIAPVLDVVSDSVRAIDDGRVVQQVMCIGMARIIPASVTAFVRFNLATEQCTVACWLEERAWAGLTYTTQETWPGSRSRSTAIDPAWRQTEAFEVLRALTGATAFLEARLGSCPTEGRLAVFARREEFRTWEVELVEACTSPLTSIDMHALRVKRDEAGPTQDPVATGSPSDREGRAPVARPPAALTRREIEVLVLLYEGLKVRTMAGQLGISACTVNKHLGNAYQKLGAHDRLGAVRAAQSLGVLPPGG